MFLPRGEIFEDASSEKGRLDILLRRTVPDKGVDARLLPSNLLELLDHLLELGRCSGTGGRQGLAGEFAHSVSEGRQGRRRAPPPVSGGYVHRAEDALIDEEAALVRAHVDRLTVLDRLQKTPSASAVHLRPHPGSYLNLHAAHVRIDGGFDLKDEPLASALERHVGIGRAGPLHRLEDPRASRSSLAQDAPSPIDLQREGLQSVEGLVHISMELTFNLLADRLGVADGNLLDPLEVREMHRA